MHRPLVEVEAAHRAIHIVRHDRLRVQHLLAQLENLYAAFQQLREEHVRCVFGDPDVARAGRQDPHVDAAPGRVLERQIESQRREEVGVSDVHVVRRWVYRRDHAARDLPPLSAVGGEEHLEKRVGLVDLKRGWCFRRFGLCRSDLF